MLHTLHLYLLLSFTQKCPHGHGPGPGFAPELLLLLLLLLWWSGSHSSCAYFLHLFGASP